MELKKVINREQQKKKRKRKINDFFRKLLIIFIGYPFVFPIEKLKEFIKKKQEIYWKSNLPKLEEKCLKEIIQYIEKDMANCKSYFIYNDTIHDEIHYSNAFYLHDFVGYGGFSYKKHSISYQYFKLSIANKVFKKDLFYEDLFQKLKKMFVLKYQDIKIEDVKHGYSHNYEGFKINIPN